MPSTGRGRGMPESHMLEDTNGFANEMNETVSGGDAGPRKDKRVLRVAKVESAAEGIKLFELVDPDGGALPPFTAGAHIEVHLGEGIIRSYSLCNAPAERHRYLIAVLREEAGRGGSRTIHDEVREGDLLTITAPRNHFALAGREARSHLLLAGGIGVTPMMAMIAELEAKGAPWAMHYVTRSPERTAFLQDLAPHVASGKVRIHHDGGDPKNGLDIKALLANFEIGTHLYYCGPPGFMEACARCTEAWPPHAIHREYFASAGQQPDESENVPFEVKIKSSGKILPVPADRTMADVLRDAGCVVETDCEDGYCGTCITRYLSGEPEHRDTVLSEKERQSYVMVCCARAKGGVIELDL